MTPKSKIIPGLYQGSRKALSLPDRATFGLVISAAMEETPFRNMDYYPHQKIVWAQFDDVDNLDLLSNPTWVSNVDRITDEVVRQYRRGKRVLVVCHMGLNRSGLVVGVALRKLGYSPRDAVALIQNRRSKYALSNSAFKAAVENWPV